MSKRGRRRGHLLRWIVILGVVFVVFKACAYSNEATQLQHNLGPGYHVVGSHP